MRYLGFDPGARVSIDQVEELAEVTLDARYDGTLVVRAQTDEGRVVTIALRSDFLDALAQARTREAAA